MSRNVIFCFFWLYETTDYRGEQFTREFKSEQAALEYITEQVNENGPAVGYSEIKQVRMSDGKAEIYEPKGRS